MKLIARVPIPYADAGLPGSGVVLRGEAFSAGTAAKGKRLVRLGFARRDSSAPAPVEVAPPAYSVTPSGSGWYRVTGASPDGRGEVSETLQGRSAVLDFLSRSGATAIRPDGSPFE